MVTCPACGKRRRLGILAPMSLWDADYAIAWFHWDDLCWYYESPRVAAAERRARGYTRREQHVSVLRVRSTRKGAGEDGSDLNALPESLLKAYPGVLEFLGATRYPDGGERVPGSLSFFIDEGQLKACLNDKDQECSAYVTGDAFKAILDTLEKKLQADSLDWRSWKKGLRRKK